MIENIAIFILGALAAGLLALLLVPAVTRRAARLAERRVRATAPLTMAEIQAQKDLQRADFAVQVRKVELRLEKVERLAAERQIALGRHEKTLRERDAELSGHRQHIRELENEVSSLKSAVLGLEKQASEQAVALKEKQKAIASANDALKDRERELSETKALADSRKVELVALTTQVENLHDRIEDLRSELAVKSVESEEHAAAADELKDELRARERVIAGRDARIARRRALSARRRRQVGELRGELAAARTELATRSLAHEALEAKNETGNDRIKALEEERAGLSQTIADLESRLDLREGELSRLQDQLAAMRGASEEEIAELRESINALAARIVGRAAASGDDEIRKLIEAAAAKGRDKVPEPGQRGGDHRPLAERIKEADLQPGE